ncbi:MAG TPA: VOC family protein [Acidimicrobiales bacterium]|nr:VOC family protein [Acidimicrobiales bacterium]
MHRSRLAVALFDVGAEDFDSEVSFWAGALGTAAGIDEKESDYATLDGVFAGLHVMVQRVGPSTAARVHVDIETDDVEAEVRRLEFLGATRVRAESKWWIMRDPAGLLFCVVPVQAPAEFHAHALTWDVPDGT